jgi:hypothetical protein
MLGGGGGGVCENAAGVIGGTLPLRSTWNDFGESFSPHT